jgi:hypothetical protein
MTYLDSLQKLADDATPGPWVDRINYDGPCQYDMAQTYAIGPFHRESPSTDQFKRAHADADFIAASREAVPKLIQALRVAMDELKQISEDCSMGCCCTTSQSIAKIEEILKTNEQEKK